MRLGLVLDGGGGKGAYQIGVWKAMRELGLDKQVKAVSGASVGGLNAVLFAQGDFDLAYQIWTKEIGHIRRISLQKDLGRLIDQYIDFSKVVNSPIDCFLAAHSIGDPEAHLEMEERGILVGRYVIGEMSYYNLRHMSQKNSSILLHSCSMPKAVMLASAALPLLCSKVRIGDKLHQDGGVPWGGDNSPDYPIAWGTMCDTMLVIHLHQMTEMKKERYPDMNVIEIIPDVPSQDLGFFSGTLNFDPEYAKRMIDAGYRDSMAKFKEHFQYDVSVIEKVSKTPFDGAYQKPDGLRCKLDKENFADLRTELHTWKK